jgi:hypothetical protein
MYFRHGYYFIFKPVQGTILLTTGNDKTRTPGPWTTFVDLVRGLHSWTTLEDHSRETPDFGGLHD